MTRGPYADGKPSAEARNWAFLGKDATLGIPSVSTGDVLPHSESHGSGADRQPHSEDRDLGAAVRHDRR